MVRFPVLSAVLVTLFLFGAEAKPCRQTTKRASSIAESLSTIASNSAATSSHSITTTTLADTTTTIQAESTTSTPETSIAQSLSTIASDSAATSSHSITTTTFADTTTTIQAESTKTTPETSAAQSSSTSASNPTLAQTTTTPAETTTSFTAPACVETQLFVNPGFDNDVASIAPWTSNNGVISQAAPQSPPNAVTYSFNVGQVISGSITQTLSNLDGTYNFSYYYRVVSISQNADYTCEMQLTVGDVTQYGSFDDSAGGWKSGSVIFTDVNAAQADVQLTTTCYGEYVLIRVDIDTLAFTRVCSL